MELVTLLNQHRERERGRKENARERAREIESERAGDDDA